MHRIHLTAVCTLLAIAATTTPAEQAFIMDGDFVVVEAENLSHTSNWSHSTKFPGYTGSGFIKWTGPLQTCAAMDSPESEHHNDLTGGCQGDPADWLRIPVLINRTGSYAVDLRNIHEREDGDNDVWIHKVGEPAPIIRAYDHNVKSYNWLTSSTTFTTWVILEPGVHTFYVAGRSVGFGIDRITVMRKIGPTDWPSAARDPSTPSVTMQDVSANTAVSPRPFGAAVKSTAISLRHAADGLRIDGIREGDAVHAVTLDGARVPVSLDHGSARVNAAHGLLVVQVLRDSRCVFSASVPGTR